MERYRFYKIAELAASRGEAKKLDAPVECPPVEYPYGQVTLFVAVEDEYAPGSNEERYYARGLDTTFLTRTEYDAYTARPLA